MELGSYRFDKLSEFCVGLEDGGLIQALPQDRADRGEIMGWEGRLAPFVEREPGDADA